MKKRIIKIFFIVLLAPNVVWGQKMPVFGDEKCTPVNDSVSNCEYNHVYGGKVAEGVRINGKANGLWLVYQSKIIIQRRYYTKGHLDSLLVYQPDGKFNKKEYYHYDSKRDTSIIYECYAWYGTGQKFMQFKNNYHIEYNIDGTKKFEGKYYEPFSLKDSTWVYSYNGKINRIENYKKGVKDGDWITYGKDNVITEKQSYYKGVLVGDEIKNTPDGKPNILIRHSYDEKKRTLIDSTFSGAEKKLAGVDSTVFLAGDTVYKSSLAFQYWSSTNHPTRFVSILVKKKENEIYRRDIHYYDNKKIKDDWAMDFLDKNIQPSTDFLSPNTTSKYYLAHVKSFCSYFEDGVLNEKYSFINNDSIYLHYEIYSQDGRLLSSITRYNPSKTDKILKYFGGKLISYSFIKPDLTYTKKEFNLLGQITEERIGALKTVKNNITLRNKTEDYYTHKKWNDKNKLIYLKVRSENNVSIKEYYDNGKMKSQVDSLNSIAGKLITTTISKKEWQENGTLFKKEKNEKTINLDLSVLKITQTGTNWDSTYSMLSGSVMNLDNKQYMEACSITLTDGKKAFDSYTEYNGYFEIKKIPEGEYTLIVTLDGFSPLVSVISIKSNQNIKCTVSLKQIQDSFPYGRKWYNDY